MRDPAIFADKPVIPLSAKNLSHPSALLDDRSAVARSAGQGRPQAGACALPLTGTSTMAGWCRFGGGTWHAIVPAFVIASVLATAIPATVFAQTSTVARPSQYSPRAAHIAEAAGRFGIPEHWIAAVMRAESAGNPRAISSAGAIGLMQIMPATWTELRVRYRLGNDPYDERDNIIAGTAYLREMFDRYRNVGAMLAAYNAGPGRYDEYLSTGRPLPAETRAYVAALTPILTGRPARDSAAPAPTVPADWRDAPLFIARVGLGLGAPSVQSGGTTDDDPEPPTESGDAGDPANADAIFIPLSTNGERP